MGRLPESVHRAPSENARRVPTGLIWISEPSAVRVFVLWSVRPTKTPGQQPGVVCCLDRACTLRALNGPGLFRQCPFQGIRSLPADCRAAHVDVLRHRGPRERPSWSAIRRAVNPASSRMVAAVFRNTCHVTAKVANQLPRINRS